MQESILDRQLLHLTVAYCLRYQCDQLSLSDSGMVSCVEEPICIRKCQIKYQLCQVINMYGGDAIGPSSVYGQWLFLLKGLLEKWK